MTTVRVTVTQDIEIDDKDWDDYGYDPDWIFGIFRDKLYSQETKWHIEKMEVIPNAP
jgi:hypothetical protein